MQHPPFLSNPKSRLGIFFVRKKSGKLRLIIDCRRTNAIFKKPPKGHVVTSTAFGELEQHLEVKDFFYRLGISDSMGEYFALEPVSEKLLLDLLTPCEKEALDPLLSGQETLYPCLTVLPMGISWGFYLAQEAHRSEVGGVSPTGK